MNVYESIKDKFIMTNARQDWARYRERLTELVLEMNPRSVMIIGAGRCNDIDLERLVELTGNVTCVDVDAASMEAAVAGLPEKLRDKVELRNVSITGINEQDLESFCDSMLMSARAWGREMTPDIFRREMMAGLDDLKKRLVRDEAELLADSIGNSSDLVLCAGVHSQLFSTLSFFIRSLIQSLADIVPGISSLEPEVNEAIRGMNNQVIPVINETLHRVAGKAVIFGNEFIPDRPVEGAEQCISYVREHFRPTEQHLEWAFNPAEGIRYDMLIQTCYM